ncbi:hypothetical protein IP88_16420 [alpha proteobacterium AAP81b]|nr:hypothetical protein IP88_16420 [alpha proteobacterium AAP81b]
MILVDSNLLVAALVAQHPHHAESSAVLLAADPAATLLATHSLAEAFAVLTRRNLPFRLAGAQAWMQLELFAARFLVVSLTAAQTLDAIRRFSRLGNGPRLYDYLIGATAEAHGADTIVTWNTRDFDGLFPGLRIVTPAGWLAPLPQTPPPMPR